MLINIMEVIEKEDGRKDKVPFIDQIMWLRVQEKLIDARMEAYPTLSICLGCSGECRQVEVVGLTRLYCGIKNKEWRK